MSKIIFDSIAQNALDTMENTLSNVFLTGKAGSGKSTLLKHFLEKTKKNVVVLAPTGVAALNVGGMTIHSFFHFSTTITLESAIKKGKSSSKNQLYTKLHSIIIDEISMVRADLFDYMDVFLQAARKSDQPFGGVQVICIGDVYQLPPVITSMERAYFMSVYKSAYFFDSKVFQRFDRIMEYIELQKVYRQKDDNFLEILNSVRNKTVSDQHLITLNSRLQKSKFEIGEGVMYLTGKNEIAQRINQEQLLKLKGTLHTSPAQVKGKFTEKQQPTEDLLKFKVGAQIMFTANDLLGRWVNGTLGLITKVAKDELLVKIIDEDEEVEVAPHTRKVNQYIYDQKTNTLQTESVGSFTQLPFTLARAITIHKSQGKTFDKAIIDFSSGIFAHGQAYVALSRCRSLEGITLTYPIHKSHIIMDNRVSDFLSQYEEVPTLSLNEKLASIQAAISNKTMIHITYQKSENTELLSKFEPHKSGLMIINGQEVYGVAGLCHSTNTKKIFKVERIKKISII